MFLAVNLVISILAVAHGVGLQYEVCQRMTKNQHEDILEKQHLLPQSANQAKATKPGRLVLRYLIISIFGTKQTHSVINLLADSHYRGDVGQEFTQLAVSHRKVLKNNKFVKKTYTAR